MSGFITVSVKFTYMYMYNITIPSWKTIERNAGHKVNVYSDIILYEARTTDYIHTANKVKIYLSECLLRA